MAAFLIYVNNERDKSQTDLACAWKSPSEKAKQKYKGTYVSTPYLFCPFWPNLNSNIDKFI